MLNLLTWKMMRVFQSTLPTRGSDPVLTSTSPKPITISIHAPHEGERHANREAVTTANTFQSTLPTRGSDVTPPDGYTTQSIFQSTLPTRGSDDCINPLSVRIEISIHAPHEGERHCRFRLCHHHVYNFNPRSPRGGATFCKRPTAQTHNISIHAPHEGERPGKSRNSRAEGIISIHAPHEGERLYTHVLAAAVRKISIHAPHEGERPAIASISAHMGYFNPRSPRGGATKCRRRGCLCRHISIHAPHEGERLWAILPT